MAVKSPDLDILPAGTIQDLGYSGGFAQNVWRHHGTWETRPGFGQLAQFDSTMALMPADLTTGHGYQDLLGFHAFRTAQGHDQLVTVLRLRAGSSNLDVGPNHWGYFYAVVVYDTYTDERWEEVLATPTSEGDEGNSPLEDRLGTWETNRNTDTQAWVYAPSAEPVFFTEYQDTLFFGNKDLGLWAYHPVDPTAGNWRRKSVDGIRDIHSAQPWSESAVVTRVTPADGLFVDNYDYLGTDAFPAPAAMTVVDNRLVLASGRDVYFTDQGRPGSIIGINVLAVPTQGNITALGEAGGNLVICTDNFETWLYRPNVGAVVTAGQLLKRSSAVGCVGQNAMVRAGGQLVWADGNGVWGSTGLDEPKELSKPLAALFDRGLPMPLSSYYQNTGNTSLAFDQPKATLRWPSQGTLGERRVGLTYESHHGLLVVSVPHQNTALVLQDGVWLVWPFESVVNSAQATVRTLANILNPQLRALQGELYLACGPEVHTPADSALTGGVTPTNENAPTGSVCLLQWGRGGALDRSVERTEDRRQLAGWHEQLLAPAANGAHILWGEPFHVAAGTTLERVTAGVQAGTVLYPVYLRINAGDLQPDRVTLILRFDNVNWRPVLANEGTADIALQFPPERHRSRCGWGPTIAALGSVPVPGTAEAQVYNSATGLVSVTGDEMRIRFDGATGAAIQTWSHANQLNVTQRGLAPLFWVPMRRLASNSTMNCGLDTVSVQVRPFGGAFATVGFRWWHHADSRGLHAAGTSTDPVQAVDWIIKSPTVGIGGPEHVRLRGVFLRVLNKGRAQSPTWTWNRALLNYVSSSNDREWATQIGDYNANYPGNLNPKTNADPLADRLLVPPVAPATNNTYDEATYNDAATWSDTGTPTDGNLLISDTPVDELGLSDSVRGDTASIMLFGHVRGRGEKLGVQVAKAQLRPAGAKRRT